ncbi:MAG TPA: cysteine desulfurase family protein [Halanaerobiales bacterium]|nr:cysteine desulfurase family protein [Halanaerobiales bacterium]
MNKIYMDHAATTPVYPEVLEEMNQYFTEEYGNPSSIHQGGQNAVRAIKKSRKKVADFINADNELEITFCGSGTEADNLAIKGVALALKEKGKHIITSKIEHSAVLNSCKYLEKYHDFNITYLDVDHNGFVNPKDVKEAINSDTILISIMMVNNEIGTIEPIKEIGEIAEKNNVFFHSDAVQAPGHLEIDVNKLKVNLLSLSAHKFNGPKGVGALYHQKGIKLISQISGGPQENHKRASTENVPAIVGMGKAAEITKKRMNKNNNKLEKLRDTLISGIEKNIDKVFLNGPRKNKRINNNINFSFKDISGESLLINLDMNGVAAASGSACASGTLEVSHVLKAIDLSPDLAEGSLRLTLGENNSIEDINYIIKLLPGIIQKLRNMSPKYNGKIE